MYCSVTILLQMLCYNSLQYNTILNYTYTEKHNRCRKALKWFIEIYATNFQKCTIYFQSIYLYTCKCTAEITFQQYTSDICFQGCYT